MLPDIIRAWRAYIEISSARLILPSLMAQKLGMEKGAMGGWLEELSTAVFFGEDRRPGVTCLSRHD
jgi:hypothetical protein